MSSHAPSAHTTRARIPWWAAALPALAFVGLLTLLSTPARAGTATRSPFPEFVGRIVEVLADHLQNLL